MAFFLSLSVRILSFCQISFFTFSSSLLFSLFLCSSLFIPQLPLCLFFPCSSHYTIFYLCLFLSLSVRPSLYMMFFLFLFTVSSQILSEVPISNDEDVGAPRANYVNRMLRRLHISSEDFLLKIVVFVFNMIHPDESIVYHYIFLVNKTKCMVVSSCICYNLGKPQKKFLY